jgi:hypothetical protein
MTTPDVAVRARCRRRRLLVAGATCLGLVASLGAGWWYLAWAAERDFQEALAETDRLDPGWRIEDLLKAREQVPEDENSALLVLKVHAALRLGGGFNFKVEESIGALAPNVQLNAEQAVALQEYLGRQEKAQAFARRLKDMPRGAYPNTYDPQKAVLTVDWVQRAREVTHFLSLGAMLATQEENGSLAADICRANLNTARSIGDDPTLIAHLVRIAMAEISIRSLQRVLAQATLAEDDLRLLQETVQREIDDPRLYWAMRGERGISMDMLQATEDGRLARSTINFGKPGWQAWLAGWLPVTLSLNRAEYLRTVNQAVEASKAPVEKQLDALERVVEERGHGNAISGSILPAFSKVASAHARNQASLRATLLALAAERYRAEKTAWPASPDDLVKAGLLKAVPVDPFDGQPMRYLRVADGVVFYSVGYDRTDNGGVIDTNNPMTPGSDIGVRLWSPESRRLPPQVTVVPE